MEIQKFKKVLEQALDIVNVGIKKGYFQEDNREYLEDKLLAIKKNGIEYDIEGTAIYGQYVPSQKKLYFNSKVYKNETEALIYILHEVKHGLDDFDNSIGFDRNYDDQNVGINEGVTQRFATDIAEEMLGEKINETIQTSLGIPLKTNLDEYQIEDHLNELFCKALGISMAELIKAQNEESQASFNKMIQKFNEYADFDMFQKSIDQIYYIQTENWYDENGELLEEEQEPTPEQTQRAMQLIGNCEIEIAKYIKMTNPERLEELRGHFIMPMNEYGEIVRDSNSIPEYKLNPNGQLEVINGADIENQISSNNEIMSDRDMLYQSDYLEYQKFIMDGIDIGNDELVFISGLDGQPFDEIYEGETTLRKNLEEGKMYKEKIYVRSGDVYKVANITFDKNGTSEISDFKQVEVLSEITEHIEHTEVIGNAPEYIRILNLQGNAEKASQVENKYKYFEDNKSQIDNIKRKMKERDSNEIGDMISAIRGIIENESSATIKDFQGVAEEPQSIEARKKVLDDLINARKNEKSKDDDKVKGE
ncbi:MAG: hypothetical protein IKD77_05375 [Bacilli bacterium]|nr:hypothetical protein [Bacilli bacterium]